MRWSKFTVVKGVLLAVLVAGIVTVIVQDNTSRQLRGQGSTPCDFCCGSSCPGDDYYSMCNNECLETGIARDYPGNEIGSCRSECNWGEDECEGVTRSCGPTTVSEGGACGEGEDCCDDGSLDTETLNSSLGTTCAIPPQ